ncbi:MAG: TonB-dependent receptor [Taibaiella sp.]|nr:TonB-dependent receptor [Taibaiella sp.]
MKNILTLTLMLASVYAVSAQNISGKVADENGDPMPGASVTIVNAKDSSEVKYSFVEADGTYLFEGIGKGNYVVRADDYSGNPFFSESFDFDGSHNYSVGDIRVKKVAEELEGVTIINRRPIVELQADKTVFNIDSTINAVGQNGLELMRKSPGVLVDKDENITISGKNGVRVYIDGRPSPLTGSELSEYLKTIQSSSIDAIEIITSPSAKYDAQGNAGIINIRMKKNQNLGTNGSINLGYNIGVFSKYNAGVNLNHRNGKVNLYGNYNVAYGNHWNDMHFDRNLNDTSFRQHVNSVSENLSHNYKAGMDYYLSDNSIIGVMVNGNARNSDNISNNNMGVSIITLRMNWYGTWLLTIR